MLITAASWALKSGRGGSIMSAMGKQGGCVGLLVYLARGREEIRRRGETDHYQRSCPVAEVRVSQLG